MTPSLLHPSRTLLLLLSLAAAACGTPSDDDGAHDVDAGVLPDAPAGAPVAALPGKLDLGAVDCGGETATTLAIGNRGGSPLEYSIESIDSRVTLDRASGRVEPGTTDVLRVTVAMPADVDAATPFTAMLRVTTNEGTPPRPVELTFRSRGAQLAFDAPMIGIGQTAVGFAATRELSLANRGDLAARVRIAPPGGEFTRQWGDGGLVELAGGATVTGSVAYLPRDLGHDQATAAVEITGVVCGHRPAALVLAGEGVLGDDVMVQGGPIDFGDVTCDGTTTSSTVTLINPTQIDAPFTAALAAGTLAGVSVSPASGVVPAGGSLALAVHRRDPAGSRPGVQTGAVLITTMLGTGRTHEIAVRQHVHTPMIGILNGRDFGVVLPGDSRIMPAEIVSFGDVPAVLSATTSNPAFTAWVPEWIATGTTELAYLAYQPISMTPASATVTITARHACTAPLTFPLEGGHGSYAQFVGGPIPGAATPLPPTLDQALTVRNLGDRPLDLTCRETEPSALAPTFTPAVLAVAPGATGTIQVTVRTDGVTPPGVVADLTCITNSTLDRTRRVQVGWTIIDGN